MRRIIASMERRYDDKASRLAKAISKLASNWDSICNFESYVAQHGDEWYKKYASDLDGLISELETFASFYGEDTDTVESSTYVCADSNFNPPADSDYGRVLQALRESGYKPETSEELVVMLATDFFEEQGEEYGYNVFTEDGMIDVGELVEYVRDSGGWKEFDYEV